MTQGIGPRLGWQLVRHFGSPNAVFPAGKKAWQGAQGIGPGLCQALADSDPAAAAVMLDTCAQADIQILCPDHPSYPKALTHFSDAPLLLFARGDASVLNADRMLAVVGARRASREGRLISKRWCRRFSDNGIHIVSGMAYGIDQAAHQGALAGSTPTIAVLGCGLACMTPAQQGIADAIIERGCILSEWAPDISAQPGHFPRRNRIISGLSAATLVMEAGTESGSLITARLAAEQGKDVLAVPGSVLNGLHAGCHQLLRDGAILSESTLDVMRALGWHARASGTAAAYTPSSSEEAMVVKALETDILHIDSIAECCNLTVPELSPILIGLELAGHVERLPGQRYILAREATNP